MALTVLWLTGLATLLLFTANVAVLASYIHRRWLRALVCAVPAVAIFFVLGFYGVISGFIFWNKILPKWLFPYILLFTLIDIAGTIVILRRAGVARKLAEGEKPTAYDWSLARLAIAFGISLALLAGTLWLKDLSVRQQLEAEKSNAIALELSLAQAWVPEEHNAQTYYDKAFAFVPAIDPWFMDNCFDEPAFDVTTEGVAKFLNGYQAALAYLHMGASFRECFPGISCPGYDFDQKQSEAMLDILRKYGTSANLLSVEARLKASKGDLAGAYQSVADIGRMGEHLSRDPQLLGFAVAIGVDSMATDTLEDVVAQSAVEIPEESAPILRREDVWRSRMVRTLQFAKAAHIHRYATRLESSQCILYSKGLAYRSPLFSSMLWRVFLVEPDIGSTDRWSEAFTPLMAVPLFEGRDEIQKLTDNLEKRWKGVLAFEWMPDVPMTNEMVAETEASARMSNLAIAITLFKQRNGTYPTTLSDLVPDFIASVPIDPFDGRPMRYLLVDDGAVIYSVGSDFQDNGGKSSCRGDRNRDTDLTFCLGGPYQKYRLEPSRENFERWEHHELQKPVGKKAPRKKTP